ncbi:MAG: YIP1 family protein [Gammaproteobacteria bacterium]|nr:YIP1 family protein [Gammaproteobacteria bacterium]
MTESTSPSFIKNLSDVFANPSAFSQRFFDAKPGVIIPLVLMITAMMVVQYVYLSSMTFDEFIALNLREVEPAARAEARQGMQMLGQTGIIAMGMVSIAIIMPIVMALTALVYMLANRISGTTERGYVDWFRASVWSSLPVLFLAVGGVVNVLISEPGSIDPMLISLTNVNGLILQIPFGEPGYKLWSALDLTSFWSIFILFSILRANGQSSVAAVIIAAIPMAVGVAIQAI